MEIITIWLSAHGIDWGIKIATAIAIFVIGKFIARVISRLLQKALQHSGTDTMLVGFLGNIAYGILLVAVVLAAIDSLGVNVTSLLAILGAAGLAVHSLFPDIPIALAFSTMLVAVPGVSIGAPFSMIFLAALTVGIGPVESIPAAISVLTAYTLTSGLGWFGLPVEKAVVDIDDTSVQEELFEMGADPTSEDS